MLGIAPHSSYVTYLLATDHVLLSLIMYVNLCSDGWQHNPGHSDDQCRDCWADRNGIAQDS